MSDSTDPIRFSVPARSPADRKKKLGRGLGALLGETKREEPLAQPETNDSGESGGNSDVYSKSGLSSLPIGSIEPLPGQPRQRFDEGALDELAASIASRGVIQPIIVTAKGQGRYQIVAGERRWRAAQKARLHEIPALVRELDEHEVMALALIENIQREDLNPVEEARAYHRLSEEEGLTQAEIAQMVEKSRSHVANLQRLLALPEGVLALVEGGELSMGHARALIGNDDAVKLAKQAVREKLSVREVEDIARGDAAPKARKSPKRSTRDPAKDADIAAVQAHLEEFLGLTVRIKTEADPRKGAVTIKYRTLDQLDLICQRLTGGDI
ncbi:ParB/RepB/Spo0J family partition protein [Altererythrobacter sp.]|uniref:ParB/RepB/Spo0J family partition protein n=1 Tax=Altererythrobacter sp. TaxID=1872480 RepID=UPI001B2F4695|nr:ParB/RepB/Spo0J family partition protein [Altererythrobacter sp.]MBO6609899.1 ParB/RepB/Spo0J family partition protein [Altererythrobacter sp.]